MASGIEPDQIDLKCKVCSREVPIKRRASRAKTLRSGRTVNKELSATCSRECQNVENGRLMKGKKKPRKLSRQCTQCETPIRAFHNNLCDECFAETKGITANCPACDKRLSRAQIAGFQSGRTLKFCSRECASKHFSGEQHPGWSGGEVEDADGYKKIRRSGGYVCKHRDVMESHLGRSLNDWETVHHIDGDKANNNLSNLELWGSRHPRGQRYKDYVDLLTTRIVSRNPRCLVGYACDKNGLPLNQEIDIVHADTGITISLELA